MNPGHMDKGAVLTLRQVAERTGLSCDAIRARVSAGTFPPPLPLGPWDTGWPVAAIEGWLAGKPRAPVSDPR